MDQHGFPGFNGGVQIHNLEAIRRNGYYNDMVDDTQYIEALLSPCCGTQGAGGLGDQDLFSV
eukprot:CAMPEP_0204552784 /NCGR_PEP_ID=MMETSP0661-20131031/26869_1 /ASSEMBLY_ACC=CAM_ASM_000606 /TAXON_ID=109239 /ORGANISM="Alexandrium margalefi, Strain AMGDE01CS-322" /LENGTH=61 /DNA_ID=CAMNT_0051559807 /DNA_START=18 /DNA_END=199 /DNA_ORIENTATION=-